MLKKLLNKIKLNKKRGMKKRNTKEQILNKIEIQKSIEKKSIIDNIKDFFKIGKQKKQNYYEKQNEVKEINNKKNKPSFINTNINSFDLRKIFKNKNKIEDKNNSENKNTKNILTNEKKKEILNRYAFEQRIKKEEELQKQQEKKYIEELNEKLMQIQEEDKQKFLYSKEIEDKKIKIENGRVVEFETHSYTDGEKKSKIMNIDENEKFLSKKMEEEMKKDQLQVLVSRMEEYSQREDISVEEMDLLEEQIDNLKITIQQINAKKEYEKQKSKELIGDTSFIEQNYFGELRAFRDVLSKSNYASLVSPEKMSELIKSFENASSATRHDFLKYHIQYLRIYYEDAFSDAVNFDKQTLEDNVQGWIYQLNGQTEIGKITGKPNLEDIVKIKSYTRL